MKLYIFAPSPNSLRAQVVANQAGFDPELIHVDLTAGEQRGELAAINPNHKIPTLVDGDFALWESNAIMFYLAGKNPQAGLVPDDLRLQAKLHQWLSWNTAYFSRFCGVILFENLFKKEYLRQEADAAALAKATEEFHRYAAVLERHLADNAWLLGERVSIADHATGSFLVHADRAGIPLQEYPRIRGWWETMRDSEPWQKALRVLARGD